MVTKHVVKFAWSPLVYTIHQKHHLLLMCDDDDDNNNNNT